MMGREGTMREEMELVLVVDMPQQKYPSCALLTESAAPVIVTSFIQYPNPTYLAKHGVR
jgi:hypothetical protein